MKRVEDYIAAYTRRYSNELDEGVAAMTGDRYAPWLTPEHARNVAVITREETLKEVWAWIRENIGLDINYECESEWVVQFDSIEEMEADFRKTMEGGV